MAGGGEGENSSLSEVMKQNYAEQNRRMDL
jgi:hypothetical protein